PAPIPARPPAGRRRASTAAASPCTLLPGDKEVVDWPERYRARELGRLHSMAVERIDAGGGGRVLSGTRRPGTEVPLLVALDEAQRERWRALVPVDPLAAQARAPGQVVVGAAAVCAVYELEGNDKRLGVTCFAMSDGRRLWHERLSGHWASALLIAGDVLLVSMSGVLEARAVATGEVRWRFER
ncbi:MAG: hypothetical protein M3680_25690, partial [Myxococcota bacterium]|nr:hypothetical protein [Myxococcota bacterium]